MDLNRYELFELKRKYKEKYKAFASVVNSVMQCAGKASQYTFQWNYILDTNNAQYNLKQFTDNCINLIEMKEYEAKRVIDEMAL